MRVRAGLSEQSYTMLQVSAPEYKPEPELEVQVQRPNLKNEQHIVKVKIGPTCKQNSMVNIKW